MRILHAAIPALLVVALLGGASIAGAAPSGSVVDSGTPPASLKCKPPKEPTQVMVKGKAKWKCAKPPAAPTSDESHPADSGGAAPAYDTSSPAEPSPPPPAPAAAAPPREPTN